MSKSTISTFELFQMFPDAEAARVYMEGKRWPDGAVCPACDEAKRMGIIYFSPLTSARESTTLFSSNKEN
jgi:hypothetical protein